MRDSGRVAIQLRERGFRLNYFDGYEMLSDGGVKLADGTVLPAYMVLSNANPTGKAVYWYAGDGPERVSYCFSPGPQG